MNNFRSPDIVIWLLLVLLAFIWGSSYILMKKGLIAYSPIQLAALRFFIAGLVLSPVLPGAIKRFPAARWKYLIFVSFIGSGIPAFLYALSISKTSSSLNGIINTLTPVFTLFIGLIFFKIAASKRKVVGILIGLFGCLILLIFNTDGVIQLNWFAMLTVLATMCYGFSSNVLKIRLGDIRALDLTALIILPILLPATIILFLLTNVVEHTITQPLAYQSLAYIALLSIVGTAFAGVLFNIIIQRTNALFASTVTYLMPAIAIGWGLLDGEEISVYYYVGLFLILTGLFLATRKETRKKIGAPIGSAPVTDSIVE